MINNGSVTLGSGDTIAPSTLTMSGGTILGGDTIEVSGLTSWSAGTMAGGGLTRMNGGASLMGTAVRDLDPRALRTAGTVTWIGSGAIRLGSGSTLENNGTWDAQGDANIATLPGGGSFSNLGSFKKTAGTTATTVSVPFTTSGSVEAASKTLSFTAGYTQTAGSTTQTGGTISSSSPLDIQGGTVGGIGSFAASIANSGTMAPGLSPAILGVGGAYTQAAAGRLAIELGGLTAGSQYDRLDATGTAAIDGTLDVSFISGFVPVAGDLFTIVTGSARTGTFATTNLPALGPFLIWNVIYNPANVQLKVLPLPSGRVPGDLASETPLTIVKVGTSITLSWSAGCYPTDSDSAVYEGVVGNFTSHVPIVCSTAGATTATFPPGTGNRYYLVVPTNGAGDGSYGLGVGGAQRPVSASQCRFQSIAPCP